MILKESKKIGNNDNFNLPKVWKMTNSFCPKLVEVTHSLFGLDVNPDTLFYG